MRINNITYWKIMLMMVIFTLITFIMHSKQCLKKFNVLAPLYPKTEENEMFPQMYEYEEKDDYKHYKYILLWTSSFTVPFIYFGKGREGFVSRKCRYQNCFIISNNDNMSDYTQFDAIAFAGPEISIISRRVSRSVFTTNWLPTKRLPHQKFFFASIESADNYPICLPSFDGFFNWTWTYRLDSERRWGNIIVRDINGNVIGPNRDMHWIKFQDMLPVSEDMKTLLKKKHKTAAWFVSNCKTKSQRERFVQALTLELKRYNLQIDVYGKCGEYNCSRSDEKACDKMLETDYFFYLAFENSFSEDYVTEKLLHALQYKTVPIVYGTANYTRFMPDSAYLNAIELGVETLAQIMYDLINDTDKYADFFKWTNHYKYHRPADYSETDDYCGFCSILNDEEKIKEVSVYNNFREWWNSPGGCA